MENNTLTNTVKQTTSPQKNVNPKVYPPFLWPYRLVGNVFLLTALVFFCFGVMVIKNNLVSQQLSSVSDYFYGITSYLGFTVDDILVYGRNKTDIDDINNIVGTNRGDNILKVDIREIKSELEKLPWVKSATVIRNYLPNILKIKIKEKEVKSLWQINNVFYPIDGDGAVINAEYIPSSPMLLLVGKGAPRQMNDLLEVITTDKEIYQRIKVANYISERRWNLILDDIENGITIKLPAQDMDKAWQKLLKLNKTQGLLKRKLTIVDLRFENKVLIKTGKSSEGERLKLGSNKESNI